jgi:hypothetical protein
MRFVYHQEEFMFVFQGEDLSQGRKVPVHTEDAVSHNQYPAALGCPRQDPFEGVDVGMGIDSKGRPREPAGVNDARMIQAIAYDQVAFCDECGDRAQVGHISSWKSNGCLDPFEPGQFGLKLGVQGGGSGY